MKLGLHRAEVAVEPHNCEWEITATYDSKTEGDTERSHYRCTAYRKHFYQGYLR